MSGAVRRWSGALVVGLVLGGQACLAGAQELQEAPDTVASQLLTLRVETVATGLTAPVAMAFLPDGTALLAQRDAGRLGLLDPRTGATTDLEGLPEIFTEGDGGVLDVAVHPQYADRGWIYVAYSARSEGGTATVVDRFRLEGRAVVDRERLFTSTPAREPSHFGGRIELAEGFLFVTIGDRQPNARPDRMEAQSTASHRGTVVRLHDDGSVPADNPFRGDATARPEVWSYGHRNAQGLTMHPGTGTLWLHEHGPQGGDEINLVRPGGNYGWPVVTYGEEYGGGPVGEGRTRGEGLLQPIYFYRPSIAPSDMVFVSERGPRAWRGSLLVGAMGQRHLNRLTLDGDRVLHEERILEDRGWRIRMVAEGPDGAIYVGTDGGLLVRLSEHGS